MDESGISNRDVNDNYIKHKLKISNFNKNGLYISNSELESENFSELVQTIKNSPVWENVEILHDSRVIVKQKVIFLFEAIRYEKKHYFFMIVFKRYRSCSISRAGTIRKDSCQENV